MKKDSIRVGLLKMIIKNYPRLSIMQVANPTGYCNSGRNRLSELRSQYFFLYQYIPPGGRKRGYYRFDVGTPLRRFKAILKEETKKG